MWVSVNSCVIFFLFYLRSLVTLNWTMKCNLYFLLRYNIFLFASILYLISYPFDFRGCYALQLIKRIKQLRKFIASKIGQKKNVFLKWDWWYKLLICCNIFLLHISRNKNLIYHHYFLWECFVVWENFNLHLIVWYHSGVLFVSINKIHED